MVAYGFYPRIMQLHFFLFFCFFFFAQLENFKSSVFAANIEKQKKNVSLKKKGWDLEIRKRSKQIDEVEECRLLSRKIYLIYTYWDT